MNESSGPRVLGRHLPVERIGEGSRSVVHLARSEGARGLVRPVVIQRFRAVAAIDARDRFVRESKILSMLGHPGVVPQVAFGTDRGALVRVLDYVTGYDLGRWLRYRRGAGRPVPTQVASHVAACALETLGYVERVATVEHALRPSNVMLDRLGNVLLTDLGLAPRRESKGADATTAILREMLVGSDDARALDALLARGLEAAPLACELRAVAGDARQALMRELDADFDGPLPRMLAVSTLEARDRAWRALDEQVRIE